MNLHFNTRFALNVVLVYIKCLHLFQAVSEVTSDKVSQLSEQIATLTNALATVTQEKSKLQTNYQADRKKIRVKFLSYFD